MVGLACSLQAADAKDPVTVVKLSEWRLGQIGKQSESLDALLQLAKESVGVPYVWGGTRLKEGIDCSNFTWMLFKTLGKPYERFVGTRFMATIKERNGLKKVSWEEVKPGDLLVYGYSEGKKWFGHVVILIDKSGKVSGHPGLVLGAHGGDVDSVQFITYEGFDDGYFKHPRMKLCNVLRVDGM